MNTKIKTIKNYTKPPQHYDLNVNVKFRSIMRKIKHKLSHHNSERLEDTIPTGQFLSLFLLKLVYKTFEFLSLKEIVESKKSTYCLNKKLNATIFISNHLCHSDPFIISELFSRHRTSFSYVLFFTSSHLNIFPLNIFYKISTSFIKRDKKMSNNDKLILQEFISESKNHDLSFFLYPEGTFSVSGNTIKMKLGLLKYLLKSDYEDMVIIKVQYTKILDFDLFPVVRNKGQWPKNKPFSIRIILERLRQVLSYSTSVYVDTKTISLRPFSENNIDSLASEIGFQLNGMYLFSDKEKMITALFTYGKNNANIDSLYQKMNSFLEYKEKAIFDENIAEICKTFNLIKKDNDITISMKNHDEMFSSINQYIYAWLPYALTPTHYSLSSIEMECLYLTPTAYRKLLDKKLNTDFLSLFHDFDIKSHLSILIKTFNIR
ncbi:1-acyl-sn-glycerol-3-phosphate acyltransferase [uncultured Shewanella sp.]|uniref:1-acyl-sn-glycerol-3-phosphate acyltransferase n=1 Tax=uncultured Shewanella sp. TaxID=173975 RepID=UPI0026318FF2|nr:1-acyl-sn-glycerol-3-phosphate acyltransferase [uncultured Shewanella sp.]